MFSPDTATGRGRSSPHRQGAATATGYSGHQTPPTATTGGARTKSIQKEGKRKLDGSSQPSPPLPTLGGGSEVPRSFHHLGGWYSASRGPSCCSTRRLVSARRAPAWLSLQGSPVLRSFVGQRPAGNRPAQPFRAAPRGDGYNGPGFGEGGARPRPASRAGSPRS